MGSYDHVAHQEGDLIFFVPPLFLHSRYYRGEVVRLLIGDLWQCIEKSRNVCVEYYQYNASCLFWKNHPIRRLCVLGTVMGFKWKWIDGEDYVFLFVDDFTSRPDDQSKFLACRCRKDLLLSYCLSIEQLTGKRLRLSGKIDVHSGELSVDDIEMCYDLMAEIEHWELCLMQRRDLNRPWELSRQICENTLTQDSWGQVGGNEDITAFATPLKPRNKQDFVEALLIEDYKQELEIVSPYRDASQREDETSDVCLNPKRLNFVIESSVPQTSEPSLLKPESSQGNPERNRTDKSIFTCSESEARVQVLKYLLSRPDRAIPVVELYQASQINDIVSDISTIIFNRQNLVLVKPFELLKSETFFEIIRKLVASGLVKYSSQNVIDSTPLKSLYKYFTDRLQGLLKLQLYSGVVEIRQIREKPSLLGVSHKAILEVLKEALRVLVNKNPDAIAGWWIETKEKESIHIHLEYSQ
ncbi:hypothetical protein HG536_0H03210 [Torulaspora globosa]|uniref:CST complex subunit Stn1 N-terminal domain-containing protein n=1 Tax=Torulaspora globosa TaxID=48254 RepID=A0A7G3ZN60_9SACH|nr:uncharacterized protein HG536_0H03210 [Torulaspora globosa]QLL34946.1 hypothetical protein HG536_0H03210 [Torulaspora globosa]